MESCFKKKKTFVPQQNLVLNFPQFLIFFLISGHILCECDNGNILTLKVHHFQLVSYRYLRHLYTLFLSGTVTNLLPPHCFHVVSATETFSLIQKTVAYTSVHKMTCLFLSHDNKHVPFGCHAVATTDPLKSFTSFINHKTSPLDTGRKLQVLYMFTLGSMFRRLLKNQTESLPQFLKFHNRGLHNIYLHIERFSQKQSLVRVQ